MSAAVILMADGSPDRLADVPDYYADVLAASARRATARVVVL